MNEELDRWIGRDEGGNGQMVREMSRKSIDRYSRQRDEREREQIDREMDE